MPAYHPQGENLMHLARWQFLAAAAALLVTACAQMPQMPWSGAPRIALSGAQEVPPLATRASGSATIAVAADRSVSGSVVTSGMRGVAAQIHQGASGRNGPVVMTLEMTGENTWKVPAGARLTTAQYTAYKKGNLYVNVRSAAHLDGEIRGQIQP